jgi:glutathione S-transferase
VLTDSDFAVWDTLAIAEYLAEVPRPAAVAARRAGPRPRPQHLRRDALGLRRAARRLRHGYRARLPEVGAIIWRDNAGVRADVGRLVAMWQELLAQHGGPMLFGEFGIADAYFTPVMMRFRTYALPAPAAVTAWMDRVCALPGVKAWIDAALAEHDFIDFEEPYRLAR